MGVYVSTFSLSLLYLDDGHKEVVWKIRSVTDNQWHYAATTIRDGNYRLMFELNGNHIRAGVDELYMTEGMCPDWSECRQLHRIYTCTVKSKYKNHATWDIYNIIPINKWLQHVYPIPHRI